MVRLSVAACFGVAILLALVLLHMISQEITLTHNISLRMNQLIQDHQNKTTRDWKQVYIVAQTSPDVESFLSRVQHHANLTVPVPAPHHSSAGASGDAETADDTRLPQHTYKQEQEQVQQPKQPAGYTQLSKELAVAHAKDKIILVTWTNFHFMDFVENWITHLLELGVPSSSQFEGCQRVRACTRSPISKQGTVWSSSQPTGVTNYMVGALDPETADRLAEIGAPYFVLFDVAENGTALGLGPQDLAWGSPAFHSMGRIKINLLNTFLGFELDVLLCDTDTVWLKDPTPYFVQYPTADILISTDHMFPTVNYGDTGLELPVAAHSAMNIGVMFFRANEAVADFVEEWVKSLDADPKAWDQHVFNMIVRQGFTQEKTHPSNERLFLGFNDRLAVGVLPVSAFASGHTYHVQHLHKTMGVPPYIVHQTFQYGGVKGKRHRLREAMLWRDPPEYYSDGEFVHAELAVLPAPDDFENLPEFNMSMFHLRNMELQLLQLRDMFAIAVATNRTLIMPKLLCYCDKYWGPVDRCRLPGARKTQLPFVCPLDHIFEPFHFDDRTEQYGMPLPFREHSFLENPLTAASVKNSAAPS